jgi:dolichol-phosphate mannosyltransferase
MSQKPISSRNTESQPKLALVIPTLNEVENIAPLLDRLQDVLQGLDWEVIFVDDDSSDETRQRIAERAQGGQQIRCIHRIGRRGLSSACVEGILSSNAPIVGIMDADMQHDESLLPSLYDAVTVEGNDLAIGSRYMPGGGVGDWKQHRQFISRWATRISQWVTGTKVSDPMSGFFMFQRGSMAPAIRNVSGLGFKLLLDLLLSADRPLKIKEVPYHFRSREAGESKLTTQVAWSMILLILDKKLGHIIPARFLSFVFVGSIGVIVHFLVLILVYKLLGADFVLGQATATLVAMTSNFLLNNISTFSDRTLSGWSLLRGWVSFVIACSIGAVANVGIANALFQQDVDWALSALAGALVGSVWNYATTAVYTWKVH